MMPKAASLRTPKWVKMLGRSEARTAPKPIRILWVVKPMSRCSLGNLSATSARNGSMEILIEASRIHNMPAAIHKDEEEGIQKSAKQESTAPKKK